MRRIVYISIILLLSCVAIQAQSKDYNEVLEDIKKGGNKISMTTLSRSALQLASMFSITMSDDVETLLDGMTSLKIVKNKSGATDKFFDNSVKAFEKAGYSGIDVSGYFDRNTLRIYGKRKWFSIREAHIVSSYDRGTNISIFGKFKMRTVRRVLKNNDFRILM